jgi:hypothetical protein
VSAHRLDEYLQALRVDVRADAIVVELDLTPGANLAADVVAALDSNSDGEIDSSEADVCVSAVLRSLELSVDDHPVGLDLVGQTIPSIDEMRVGSGVISVVATADFGYSRGHHQLRISNGFRADVGVYLANALRPDSRTISIASQARDPRQQTLTVDFVVNAPLAATASAWTAVALVLLGCCVYWRRQTSRASENVNLLRFKALELRRRRGERPAQVTPRTLLVAQPGLGMGRLMPTWAPFRAIVCMGARLICIAVRRIEAANYALHHVEIGLAPIDVSGFLIFHAPTSGIGACEMPRRISTVHASRFSGLGSCSRSVQVRGSTDSRTSNRESSTQNAESNMNTNREP